MRDEAPALVWPRLLGLPSDGVKIVYLDLNHWIYLAQAASGHPRSRYAANALDACRGARCAGTAVFVLSGTHYAEMLKINNPAQRRALADLMEELTDFAALVSRIVVMEVELSSMLDPFAKLASPLSPVPLIGRGVRHTAGLQRGLKLMGPSGDETDRIRERIGEEAFIDPVADANLLMERSVLRGPTDDQVPELRAFGWNPEAVTEIAEKRAAEERAQSMRLDAESRWRRGRLHDLVSARELMIEFQNILPRALAERGLALSDVASDVNVARRFVRAMPSTEVSITLKAAWHRNRDKQWSANDIYDIDAMALAVPYCDIVVTEKACHHVLEASRLGHRMHTALLRSLEDLPAVFERWQPKRPPFQ
jgi:hypothetical protein